MKNPERSVANLIDPERQVIAEHNTNVLITIIRIVLLLARQSISFRSHRDSVASFLSDSTSNKGNFLALVEEISLYSPDLSKHLKDNKQNAVYLSPITQNDVLDSIKSVLLRCLLAPLVKSTYFAIIADEVMERFSARSVLSICLRFCDLDQCTVEEKFLSFTELEGLSGAEIGTEIIRVIDSDLELNIENCRAQCYDGAAAMRSENIGAQRIVREKSSRALHVHCALHRLNLVVVKACKIPLVRNIMDTLTDLHYFFENSPKRQRYFETKCKEDNVKFRKIKNMCKTRWVERIEAFEDVVTLMNVVLETLCCMFSPGKKIKVLCIIC